MIRRAMTILGWIGAGVVAFVVVVYLIAVAVNWQDQEASEAARRLDALYRDRPAIADRDNAFVYVMGFDVAPTEDPRAMGTRRIAWLQQFKSTERPDTDDPLGKRQDHRASRSPRIKAFLEACRPDSPDCASAFDTSDEVFEEWIASEGWLLERYRALLAHPGWRETVPFGMETPLPSYAPLVDGQRLLLLKARMLARKGEHEGAKELLGADMLFWRRVLESSDLLITKMIATSALQRNLGWGNRIVRRLDPMNVPKVVPDSWKIALSDSERSMQRCLVGEWKFISSRILDISATSSYSGYGDEDSWDTKVAVSLFAPMYQRQDLLNNYAEYYLHTAERLKVPFEEYAAAVADIDRLAQRIADDAFPPRSLYNVAGKLLLSMGVSNFEAYASRVADLEGVRRAVLTSAMLRESNVAVPEVAAALATTGLRNPYNGQPLVWDEQANAIVFQGLETHERGRHSISYAIE